MEQKLDKLFSIFENLKKQDLYTLCVRQIIQIHKDSPQSVHYILKKILKLIYSNVKDKKLQLEHRLIASSLIENMFQSYTENIKNFLENYEEGENYQGIFQISFQEKEDYENQLKNLSKKQEMDLEIEEKKYKVVQQIREQDGYVQLKEIDFENLFNNDIPLYAKNSDELQQSANENQKRKEEEIFGKLNMTQNLNEASVGAVLGSIKMDIFNMSKMSDDENEDEEEEELRTKKNSQNKRIKIRNKSLNSKQEKLQKKLKKNANINQNIQLEEEQEQQNILENKHKIIVNPFNLLYEICSDNLLDLNWQTRHSSALILRGLISNAQGFATLGFQQIIEENENISYQDILKQARNQLLDYLNNESILQQKMQDIASKNMIIIALDRFADYISDTSNIIVRETSSQILSNFMKNYMNDEQIWEILDYLLLFLQQKEWEIKQSSLFLLKSLLEVRQDLRQGVFEKFQSVLLQLINIDEIDDVLLIVGQVYLVLCGEEFFFQQKYDQYVKDLGVKVWGVIEFLDDITYATKVLLDLLSQVFSFSGIQKDYQGYIKKLFPLFYHKTTEVRCSGYLLSQTLLDKLKNSSEKLDYELLENLFQLLVQAVTIEDHRPNFLNAEKALVLCYEIFEKSKENQGQLLQNLRDIAVSQESTHNMKEYFYIREGCNYDGIISDSQQGPLQHLDSTFFRLLKLSQCTHEILKNRLKEKITIEFLKELKDSEEKRHRNLLYFMIILSQIDVFNYKILFAHIISMQELEQILNIDTFSLEAVELSVLDNQIQSCCNSLNQFSQYGKLKTVQERRQNYEQIYNVLQQKGDQKSETEQILSNSIQSFVNQAMELRNNLKGYADGIYVRNFEFLTNQIEKNRLNLVIKPLMLKMHKEKYFMQSQFISQSFFSLTKCLQFSGPAVRVITNLNKGVLDKSNLVKKYIDFSNDKEKRIDRLFKYSEKYTAVNQYYGQFFGEFQEDSFEKLPSLKNFFYVKENLESNLEMLKFIKKILPSLIDMNLYECLLKQLISDLFFLGDHEMKLQQAQKKQVIKILEKLFLTIIKKEVKNLDQNNNIEKKFLDLQNLFLESFYKLLKNRREIGYVILENILNNNSQHFVDYASIFVLQVVKSITYTDQFVKEKAFNILGLIITSLFLQQGNAFKEEELTEFLKKKNMKGTRFILDFKNQENFEYQLQKPKVDLRQYQIDGIKWMGFLSKYNLNGALCDDMGLGKTLQTLSVIQSEIYKNRKQMKKNSKKQISLVIAPPTLQEHWKCEVDKFLESDINCQVYKQGLNLKNLDIVVTSYSTVSRKFDVFKDIQFLFIVLDEGHLIKNHKTKVAQSIRKLKSQHKLLLSGTPIQNNILELWAIFDFLMPGYLGSEELFRKKFSKLFATNLMAFSDKDLLFSEEQTKALAELHKRVLPFIMRRDKQQVLKELPPKIIQDFPCYLTESQQVLYDWLQETHIRSCEKELQSELAEQNKQQQQNNQNQSVCKNVLQMLIMLRKVVNHPQMLDQSVLQQLKVKQDRVQGIECSGKFQSLKQLFVDLGFEQTSSSIDTDYDNESTAVSQNNNNQQDIIYQKNQNKVLIFSRFKQTLQLIENLILGVYFKKTKYLKLDGDVATNRRFKIANRFNEDSEVKILLLTTTVGGLGLNLTSANCVIMFDHDYNPSNDIQAIDRAHRIGQKNVVNVYRLMTKDTLEEKIMGIQRFKLSVANAVINLDNASIKNVKDSNIVELFDNLQEDNRDEKQEKKQGKEDEQINKYQPYKKLLAEMEGEIDEEVDFNRRYI